MQQELPFAEFLGYLTRQGFIIGVDQHLRLHTLLHRLGPDCPPLRLKSLLCPLFATNEKQQQQFYRAFDAYFAAFDPQRAQKEAEAEAGPPEEKTQAAPPLWARKWTYVLAGLLLLVLFAFGIHWYLNISTLRKLTEVETPDPSTVPEVSLVQHPIKEQIVPLVTLTTPQIEPETRLEALWRKYGATLRWLAFFTPAVIFLLAEGYRLNRRKLVLERERRKTAPYLFQLQVEPPDPAFLKDERFYTAARLMRRRLQSDVLRLDPEATVKRTIGSGGFPSLQYKPLTRPPEYLVLIERPLGRDHYSRLCETLSQALQHEGIFVTRYFYERNPRICFQTPEGKREYLYELKDRFPDHRLLILGAGEELLDPLSGNLDTWTTVFQAWRERAILTTVAPSEWGLCEITLASEFVVLPATLDGLAALVEYFEFSQDINVRSQFSLDINVQSQSSSRLKPASLSGQDVLASFSFEPGVLIPGQKPGSESGVFIPELRAYLGEDVFQWLCACAVYPELHWNLTLSLAALPCMPANLITEANLLRLIRLPWFREGALPEDLRLALINELGPKQSKGIRSALIAMLERQDPPPPESGAYDVYQLHLAVQRLWLLSWKKRRKWKQRLREQAGAGARRILQDYTFVRFLESERVSPLNLVLPRRLRKLFFRQGVPWFGLKTSVCALCTGMIMAAVLGLFPQPQPPAAVSDFVMHTFQVTDLPAEHPAAVVEEGARLIPASSTSAYLCYGAQITLPAIDVLDAHFSLAIDNNTADDRSIAVLEVYDVARQTVLQQKSITRRMFPSAGAFSNFKVSFGLEAATQLEFRVFYEGGAALKADTITLANPAKTMEMIWIEGDCFYMGSPDSEEGRWDDEGPVHEVCLDGFWMGKYEVTNRQYRNWKPEHDSSDYQGHSLNAEDQPVVYVSWSEAREFTDWLNAQNQEGSEFRLPTEAEWEYAARAGTTTIRFWGDNADEACQYANVADQTAKQQWSDWTIHNCDDGYAVAAPVGSFRPNQFGLYDMLGNVWEWCADWYASDYYASSPRQNPQGPSDGSNRVIRGGSWNSEPRIVRSASRARGAPSFRLANLGLRLVRKK